MAALVLVVSMVVAAIGFCYLELGRNRHGETAPPSAKQISPRAMTTYSVMLKPEPYRTVMVYFLMPSRGDDGANF